MLYFSRASRRLRNWRLEVKLAFAEREIRRSKRNLHISNAAEGEDQAVDIEAVVVGQCWVSHAVCQFAVDEARAEGCLEACEYINKSNMA